MSPVLSRATTEANLYQRESGRDRWINNYSGKSIQLQQRSIRKPKANDQVRIELNHQKQSSTKWIEGDSESETICQMGENKRPGPNKREREVLEYHRLSNPECGDQ